VMELWEDVRQESSELPAGDRHYVRVLFNGREVTVRTPPGKGMKDSTGTVYDQCDPEKGEFECLPQRLTLQQFQEGILDTFAMSEKQHSKHCKLPTSVWRLLGFSRRKDEPKEDTSKY
jgi:hypothetical protein